MTTETAKTPFWKSPYFIGFFCGAIGLIAIRPIQQAVKHAPPPILSPGDWSLTSHEGKAFGSAELKGKVWVADFFFTRCPSICPELTQQMIRLKKNIDKHPEVRFVSFSVDPENDNPEVLRAYRKKYGIDDDKWTFLTGSRAQMHNVLAGAFKLHVGDKELLDPQGDLYDIAHDKRFALFDQRGDLRALATTDSHGLARLEDAVRLLIQKGPDA